MVIGDLIRLLSDGNYHSGEELGEQLGVSRTAVWKQLKKLEGLDIPLEAVKGLGYRLAESVELLDGATIIAQLPAHSRAQLQRLFVEEALPSTNQYLRDRFALGAGHAEVCLAESQTAGRGRRGRAWMCPWGRGLLLSMGWRFEGGVNSVEGLSLAVGVVVAQVLERHGLSISLKWPNDILLEGGGQYRKLAGILLEVSGDFSGPCDLVIGLGLNVSLPRESRHDVDQPTAAVHDVSPGIGRNQLAAELLEALFQMLPGFDHEGFGPWCQEWNARHAYAGAEVEVIQGDRQYAGIAEGVDASGCLLVRRGGGLEKLAGGEVSVRGSA
ncbi:biotin--[acetyl-CoA-carboxylase] ligase [Aidingimonas halophila]|uniref:Bifunctional ligase/repressor BirA n=1 Tax=Aidingimonas halophila TaxID=574349 RepID=A0A1H3HPN1_9GAMM|nr:biotin--[acetyl-CoA-carboxylase] ligase [Aidingimonas halophila]GHC37523.1 bifunctional ligase/repressor BirA [Aidingimonas halophila]SDY17471.1 BirA family transcriptional regulator, biotin operon repressor / biotin-[acetyl-CoA-carboxylase] ligase [Aidingimonas halophila]